MSKIVIGDSRVIESREVSDGVTIRRRREAPDGTRFTTYKRIEKPNLAVIKKNGSRELYDWLDENEEQQGAALCWVNDPAVIERLWNPFIAAWYTGKDDPKLRLLRFDPGVGELWQNSSSLLAGIKMLLGADPKRDFQEDVAKVCLGKG